MCFVWISKKSTTVSLNSLKWFVFITYSEYLHRSEKFYFNKSQLNLNSKSSCNVWGALLPTSDFGDAVSILGQNISYLWCTKWHKNTYLTRLVYYILSVLFSRGFGNLFADYSPRSPGFNYISVVWICGMQTGSITDYFPSTWVLTCKHCLTELLNASYCIVCPDKINKQWKSSRNNGLWKSGGIGHKCELIFCYYFIKPGHQTYLSM